MLLLLFFFWFVSGKRSLLIGLSARGTRERILVIREYIISSGPTLMFAAIVYSPLSPKNIDLVSLSFFFFFLPYKYIYTLLLAFSSPGQINSVARVVGMCTVNTLRLDKCSRGMKYDSVIPISRSTFGIIIIISSLSAG